MTTKQHFAFRALTTAAAAMSNDNVFPKELLEKEKKAYDYAAKLYQRRTECYTRQIYFQMRIEPDKSGNAVKTEYKLSKTELAHIAGSTGELSSYTAFLVNDVAFRNVRNDSRVPFAADVPFVGQRCGLVCNNPEPATFAIEPGIGQSCCAQITDGFIDRLVDSFPFAMLMTDDMVSQFSVEKNGKVYIPWHGNDANPTANKIDTDFYENKTIYGCLIELAFTMMLRSGEIKRINEVTALSRDKMVISIDLNVWNLAEKKMREILESVRARTVIIPGTSDLKDPRVAFREMGFLPGEYITSSFDWSVQPIQPPTFSTTTIQVPQKDIYTARFSQGIRGGDKYSEQMLKIPINISGSLETRMRVLDVSF